MHITDTGHHDTDDGALAGAKGHEYINADGHWLIIGDPGSLAKFAIIKAKAIKAGEYEGKSLQFGKGGRARMFYDQLRLEGHDHVGAKEIIRMNYLRKLQLRG